MKNWLSAVPLKTVFSLLPNDIKKKTSLDSLEELHSSSKKNYVRKRFYKLNLPQSKTLHLTYGSELDHQYENSKAIYDVIPEFTCKPLFINNKDEYSLFGQKFFEGEAIDHSYNERRIKKSEVTKILEKIHIIFQNLEKPSSIEFAKEEFKGFCETTLENSLFSEVDFQILKKEIFPLISSWIEKSNPTIRWTTGDLAARNILVNNNNDFRIVDCEFACKTHFHQEDWVRLSKFSEGKFCDIPFIKGISEEITFPVKLINLLKQTNLNRLVHNKLDYNFYLNQDAFDTLKEISSTGEIKSIFLKAFSSRYEFISDSLSKECALNLKLQKDLEKLTHEIDELREFKTNSLHMIKQLQETSTEYQEKLVQRENKIFRMQNSFSWKITSPLRFLRRCKEKLFKDFPKMINHQKKFIVSAHLKKNRKQNRENISSPFELKDLYSKKSGSKRIKSFDQNCFKTIWLIPDFGIGSGGHTTIFRTIMWLEKFGHLSKIFICGSTQHGSAQKAKELINSHFFKLDSCVEILIEPSQLDNTLDPIISTSFETCYFSRGINSSAKRFYFVQDYEPEFMPVGSYYFLAKETYLFGFNCITAGKWLASKIKSEGGNVSGFFELAVDKNIFFPIKTNEKNKVFQIAVYCRSATPRRMSEVVIYGLNLLNQKGYKFKVCFFGDTKLPVSASFEYEVKGVLSPINLAQLYRSSDFGCVFSSTNYSLVPLEMMACGIPVLEFDGQNTRQTYPDGSVIFAKPSPQAIANSLESLFIADPNCEQITAGLDYIRELSWEESVRKIEYIIKT
ncbi:MAG: hypothetical protein VX609_07785, partial [Verrucomicrobiota bacterium]|nr:hypothetical protein [Verrucomicrobiota bacterium]